MWFDKKKEWVTINLIGVEDAKSPRRPTQGHPVRLYGYRDGDLARRLVGVEVPCELATEVVMGYNQMTPPRSFGDIEVEDQRWFFVGPIGENEALFHPGG